MWSCLSRSRPGAKATRGARVQLVVVSEGARADDGSLVVVTGHGQRGTAEGGQRVVPADLAERGVASVRYDKGGVAASAGAAPRREADLSFDMYVDDAERCVAAMVGWDLSWCCTPAIPWSVSCCPWCAGPAGGTPGTG